MVGRMGLTVCGCCFRGNYSCLLLRVIRLKEGDDHMQGRPQALRHPPEGNHSFKRFNAQEEVTSELGNCQDLGAGSWTKT